MAHRYPPETRARNADRESTCTRLDSAFGDGQLDEQEYAARTELARTSRTLGDLAVLTEDLQTVDPPAPRPPRALPVLAAAVAVASVVAAVGAYALVRDGGDDRAGADPAAVVGVDGDALAPIVIPHPSPVTAEGMALVFERYRDKFGDTVVDEMNLYASGHASLDRALPAEPNRGVSYSYRGGFTRSGQATTSRRIDTPTIDLATIDVAAIARHLDTAPAGLNVPDGTVDHISIETDRDGAAGLRVFVRNDFSESGYLELTPAGELLRSRPFEG